MTPADHLRAAVAALRCHHQYPCQPPHGSVARPGPCTACGTPWDGREPAPGWLREPLAAWLQWTIAWNHDPVETDTPGVWECAGCVKNGLDLQVVPERCPAWIALRVARAVRPDGDAG
jgi:hypothetical protein